MSLSKEEDSFALAVIEYDGNLGAAFRAAFGEEQAYPIARARDLITRPEIAKRIAELRAVIEEHGQVSMASHLNRLAEIRDLAIKSDQLKVALGAETQRGVAAGFYKKDDPKTPSEGRPSVHIHISQSSPATMVEWAQRANTTPVVIENGS